MPECEDTLEMLFRYLDGELPPPKSRELESHLESCAGCRRSAAGRRAFLETLAAARPDVRAPLPLRRRMESVLRAEEPGWRLRARTILLFRRPYEAAAAAALAVAVLAAVFMGRTGQKPRSEFAAAGLAAHRQRLAGDLVPGLRSSSAEVVSAWFQNRIGVPVRLPATEDPAVQTIPYEIQGAGVIRGARGTNLGYVSYAVQGHAVTLVIAPSAEVALDGRRQVAMKSLRIHYDAAGGFHIVTWTVPRKSVAYALISDSSRHANEACVVCHAGRKDRAFMASLLN